jgi:monofunctional biosynthetic peptidoglycan transglycosylase
MVPIMTINLTPFVYGASEDMKTQLTMVTDFKDSGEVDQWRIVNDGVMGGLSQSQILTTNDKTAIFQGEVSLENYGGFASVRTIPRPYNLAGYSGFMIRIKGDGKRYQLRLRTDNRFDGPSYRHSFSTRENEWITVQIPFRDFVPTFRGRVLTDAPPLSPEQIQQIGFLISDKQEGAFQLEIDWIQAYK